jgi:CMP/dCMP kinase
MKRIIVAIDGFSSTGKSTLAKQLAKKLNYTYIDSGAMYRAITLFFLRHNIKYTDNELIEHALSDVHLNFVENRICLNNEFVEDEIRSMEISNLVSEVSALEAVRTFAVAQQQRMGVAKGIVMDGRDIGTTVFPQAELKIFLSATKKIRVQRRFDEMKLKNSLVTFDEVQDNLEHRDHIDSTRLISPLRKADDATELDNSALSMPEQLNIAYEWAMQKINI